MALLSNRVQWVDVAKALAIILVVIGHMGFPEDVRAVIYGFHMPLFFMLSGMFVSTKEDFRRFLVKKARTLLIPYLCFNVIFIVFDLVQSIMIGQNYSLVNSAVGTLLGLRYGYECVGRFWFLPCLFIAEVFMYGVLKLSNSMQQGGVIVLFSFVGVVCNWYFSKAMPYSIDMALVSVPFLYVGYLYFKKFKNTPPNSLKIVILALTYVISMSANYLLMDARRVDMYEAQLGNYLLFYVAAMTGSFIVILISMKIRQNSLLLFLGRNTLAIYGFHMIVGVILSTLASRIIGTPQSEVEMVMLGVAKTVTNLSLMIPICVIVNKYFPWILGRSK